MKDNDVKLIGICGAARSGKNTLARNMTQFLADTPVEELQDHIIAIESFAAPIKSMTAMLLDFFGYGSIMNPDSLRPYIEGDSREEELDKLGVSTRTIQQTLGTDWGRKLIKDSIWIDCMEGRLGQFAEAKNHGHKGAIVFITDVRFDNEAEMIHRLGGTIVKVNTERAIPYMEHESEKGLSACMVDAEIDNSGTLEEFRDRSLILLEGIFGTFVAHAPVKLPPEEDTNETD